MSLPLNLSNCIALYTNKLGLQYTLTNILDPDPAASLVYHNNPLNDCVIHVIQISVEAKDRAAIQYGWQEYGPKAKVVKINPSSNSRLDTYLKSQVFAKCTVPTSEGSAIINLTTEYDYLPPKIGQGEGYTSLLRLDQKKNAAL